MLPDHLITHGSQGVNFCRKLVPSRFVAGQMALLCPSPVIARCVRSGIKSCLPVHSVLSGGPRTPTHLFKARPAVAGTCGRRSGQFTCNSSFGDLPVSADTLGDRAATVRNFAFASFWVQLPLTIVSAGILFFAVSFSKAPSDVSRWFTLVGIVASFISTFVAHGVHTLAKQAINEGRVVSRSFLVQNLVRNININLAGIGITLLGLQASVGTLVSKTMLAAANAPYAASPSPGGTLVSLDVFSLQASTNTLLAHFLSVVFANFIIGAVNKIKTRPAAA
ncbi:hypothetical protein COO60DRAFT_726021 [Scenedesmus sp. NREL 46B-D3]|nr:hypothetical protein COO60DRAFT_726021 [Scenedesmus sp. NREL 46B-D3]